MKNVARITGLALVLPVWCALFGVLLIAAACDVRRVDDVDPHAGGGA